MITALRLSMVLLLAFASCTRPNDPSPFASLVNREEINIYLSHYKLDSVPPAIGTLTKARWLLIARDSTTGWTIYPPLSATQERVASPPFCSLPREIGQLTQLRYLALIDLHLQQLPEELASLQQLDTLNLLMNKLVVANELPTLLKIKKLRHLVLTGNQVSPTDLEVLRQALPHLSIESGL